MHSFLVLVMLSHRESPQLNLKDVNAVKRTYKTEIILRSLMTGFYVLSNTSLDINVWRNYGRSLR